MSTNNSHVFKTCLATELYDLLGNKPYRTGSEMTESGLHTDNDIFGLGHDVPKLGRHKVIIVSGVAFSANRDVVMIQEAKESARGQWYLPAGRLELNESLQVAVKREYLEEAGLQFEPRRLISIECSNCSWIRFNFLGDIVGGKLKVTEDKESLCAKWVPTIDVVQGKINLRSSDIIPVILLASHLDTKAKLPLRRPSSAALAAQRLPLQVGWRACHVRLLLLCQEASSAGGGGLVALCRLLHRQQPEQAAAAAAQLDDAAVMSARLPLLRVPHPLQMDTLAELVESKVVGHPVELNCVLHSEFSSSNDGNCGIFLTVLCRLVGSPALESPTPTTAPPPTPLNPAAFGWVPVKDELQLLCRNLVTPPDQFASDGRRDLAVKTNPLTTHLCRIRGCRHAAFDLA